MADFNVGSAWISLKPESSKFSREAKRDLARLDLSASVDLDADRRKLDAAVKEAREELQALERERVSPSIDLDIAVAEARARELQSILHDLGAQTATPAVETQTAEARRELAQVTRTLEELNHRRATVDVDADIAAAAGRLEQLEGKLDEVDRLRAEPTVTADTTQARARLAELNGLLNRISTQNASPQVELRAAQARQEALRIRAELDRLGALRATPQVQADIAAASAKLAAINAALARLDGRNVRVNVNAGGAGTTAALLLGVVAALGAIVVVAPAAVAALSAVAGAGGALGQGVAAGMAGLSGVGDALKALEADEKSAATSSASSSDTRSTAAKQVASAQRALGQAQIQADRAAITGAQQVASAQAALSQARVQQARTAVSGAQQVADAERALAQASASAARTRITADQQVASARRAVSDAVVSANTRVASAERSLESANRSRQYAQEALTRATEDATRANRDLQLSVAGGALATERAALSLQQARKRLAQASSADPLELADLSLSVREAEQNLKETQVRYGDLTDEQAKWARTGVAGSEQVVSATRALQEAQRGVGDAQQGLTEAQVSGARQVSDAQAALGQASQQAAWQIADAQQGVADAQRNVGRAAAAAAQANADAATQVTEAQRAVGQAVQQAGWAQQDAARSVEDAQRSLAEAYTAGGAAAAGGAQQAAYALAKLTPAGRSLVSFLKDEWQPAWKRVTDSVAEAMLPKVERGLRNLLALEPVVKAGLTEAGSVIGDLAVKGSELASSAPFQANFASIMAANNRSLRSYGDAGLNLFGAFTDLYAAAGPINEEFARMASSSTDAFESWILGARQAGDLDKWLRQAADTLQYFGQWTVDVGTDVVQFATSLAPLGTVLLEVARGVADWVSWLAQLSPELTSVVVGAGLAAVAATKLGTAMSGLAIAQGATGLRAFGNVAGSVGGGLRTLLTPSLLAATTPMQMFGNVSNIAAQRMGVGQEAAGRFGSNMAKLGSTLPIAGLALVGVGLIMDATTTSTDEATEAVMRGGQAANEAAVEAAGMTAKYDSLRAVFGDTITSAEEWIGTNVFGIATTKSLNDELKKQREEMTALGRAQSEATQAQATYDLTVRLAGPNSVAAGVAQRNLADKTAAVAQEQEKARRATMNATQALQDQQDKILASIDSRLALRQSTQQVKQAQDEFAAAVRNSGAGSDEAQQAQVRLEQAQSAQAAAARRSADEEGKRKGIVDTSTLSNQAYAQSIGDMVAKTQGQMTPALTEMVQSLDGAGLAAAGAKVHIDGAGNAIATFPNGKTVTLTAQTSPEFFAQLNVVKTAVDSTRGTIGVDADTGPGTAKVGNFKLATDATRGVVTVDGNITPADQQRLGIQAKTDGTTGTMWINGNPVQCDGALNGARFRVDTATGVMTIDGNPAPADAKAGALRVRTSGTVTMPVDMDTRPAEGNWSKFLRWLSLPDWMVNLLGGQTGPPGANAGGLVHRAQGGLVQAYAAGGSVGDLQHKQVIQGFPAGGRVRGPGTATSDSVPAMLSNGEYVIRASSVAALGVPTLDALNRMASGGLVGYAAGGPARPQGPPQVAASTDAAAAAPAAVTVPTGDAGAAAGAASATAALAGSMGVASTAAGVLAPQLAAVTAQQQAMVSSGVTPLAGAIVSQLSPAMGLYAADVGVTAPLANAALQTAQGLTQLSTAQTAANTALNSQAMAAATTGMSATAQAQHAGLRAGQFATQVSTNQTAVNAGVNNASMAATNTAMSLQAQAQHAGLRAGQLATQVSSNVTAANTAGNNLNMQVTTGQMSAVNQGHLGNVRLAQGVTTGSTIAFADAWRAQLARTMPDSANPLRYAINVPIRGITDAWNNLDGQFALGKHVNPYVAGFASGGRVSGPGGGTDDKVPAMLSHGEFVVREKVTDRVAPFLKALNSGQPEAMQAAGAGRRAVRMAGGGSVAEALGRAHAFARSMNGRPYIWGGPTTAGTDCSGYQGMITSVLRGEPPHRIGTTASFPWPGFTPGLTGAYSIGAFKGSPGHMAGTLGNPGGAGAVNVESGGSPSKVKYGAGAVGADNGQFNIRASLGIIGGKFVSGGAGGAGFDPTPAVMEAFAKVYRDIDAMPGMFGPSDQVARDIGVARFSADKVKDHALTKLTEMFAFSGGGNAAMWRPQIMQALGMVGQSPAHAGITEARMNKESGGNPRAINLWDSNARRGTPSKGLMQMIDPTFNSNWDPRTPHDIWNPLSNIVASMHYALRRYGSLPAAYNRPGGYDNGGLLMPGRTLVENNTGFPERVLDNVETRSYDTLTRLVGKNGVQVDVTNLNDGSAAPAVHIDTLMTPPGETATGMAKALTWQVRTAKRGGVYAR